MNRQTNRKAGSFKAVARRVRDAELDQLDDNRSRHGRRFKWSALLNALVLGACVAARTLRAVETLTMDVAQTVRRATGIRCRISDTKLRDTLLSLEPQQLRAALHRLVKAEQRRGHLTPKRFPFGVVAIDGKCLGKLDRWDYADIQPVRPAGAKWYGLARVLRAHLVSANPILTT